MGPGAPRRWAAEEGRPRPNCASWVDIAEELNGVCEAVPIDDPQRLDNARLDLADVRRSDAVIVLVPNAGGTGMWIELGYALGLGIRVLTVGPAVQRSLFCELCERYETAELAVVSLAP